MNKIFVAVVLGIAVGAVAVSTAAPAQGQSATPPAQGQAAAAPASSASQTPAAPAAQAPVIKDPAEYNSYVAAYQQKDPNAQISGLEAFLAQYPNSVMKSQALELLMGAYQATNNMKKTMDTAGKVVANDPCQLRALALLAYYDRYLAQNAQANDPNVKTELADGKKYGQQGLDCLGKTTDAELLKMKPQMTGIFKSVLGIAAYTDGDYPTAAQDLHDAIDASPDNKKDFGLVYPMALAYLKSTPPDYQNGIWFAARAAAVAPAGAQAGVEKYARGQYIKFHSADDGWAEVIAAAKSDAPQMAIKPAPTPAEQAHNMVEATKSCDSSTPPVCKYAAEKMDFATWEFVLSNGAQVDQDAIWNVIKGQPVQMNGTIIGTTPTEFQIAGSSDDIDAKKADITLKFEDKLPVKLIPKDGASFDFKGEPASYTPNPFMMVMEKGKVLTKAVPAAAKPPVHKKPAAQ